MIAKQIYQKPEIVSVAIKVSGFFAATQDYDSDEVANALNAAGILSDNDVQKFGNNHEIIEIYS